MNLPPFDPKVFGALPLHGDDGSDPLPRSQWLEKRTIEATWVSVADLSPDELGTPMQRYKLTR